MLELKNISYEVRGREKKKILDSINIKIEGGDFIVLIGGNGAGKSTLLKVIAGEVIPSGGEVYLGEKLINDYNTEERSEWISRVFQDSTIGCCMDLSIEENLSIAYYRGKRRDFRLAINKATIDIFKEEVSTLNMDLENQMDRLMGELSGGQRQAICLLMATLVRCKVLLLDEHTAALDAKSAEKILEITQSRIKKHQLTTIMITHQLSHIKKLGNKLCVMSGGKIVKIEEKNERFQLSNEDIVELLG